MQLPGLIYLMLLLQPAATTTPLSSLLSSHIASAQCEARCSSEPVEGAQCREVCSLLLSSPSSPLCSLPLLCSPGCRTACSPPPPTHTATLSLLLSPCSLSWSLSSPLPAVFLVAGLDPGRKWHLVASTSSFSLPLSLLSPYTTASVLAVASGGLLAIQETRLQEQELCREERQQSEELPAARSFHISLSLSLRSVVYLAVPASLASLALLALLLCLRRYNSLRGLQEPEITYSVVPTPHTPHQTTPPHTQNSATPSYTPYRSLSPYKAHSATNVTPPYTLASKSLQPVSPMVNKQKLGASRTRGRELMARDLGNMYEEIENCSTFYSNNSYRKKLKYTS